jgi:hypothetical protein
MSLVSVESNRFLQFMQMAVNNPSILHRLNNLPADDQAGLIKIASEAGFTVSTEEVNAVVEEVESRIIPGDELSEGELDAVTGGTDKSQTMYDIISRIINALQDQGNATIKNIKG